MSNSLAPNLVKAMAGDYHLPIKAIFIEAWRRVTGIKKSYWGGFSLFLLTMLVVSLLLGLVLALYDFFILYPHESLSSLANIKLVLKFFVVAVVEVLRLLLTASLAYLALQHVRHKPTRASMVFSFRQAWQSLVLLGFMWYLFNVLLLAVNHFLLKGMINPWQHLSEDNIAHLIWTSGYMLRLLLFFLLYTYIMLGIFMAILLVLDQKMRFKNSLLIAFKSIKQHFLKNMVLALLTGFGFVILTLVTLGIGLIWLLPMLSLVIAIQYQQIFCQGNLE